MKSIIIAGTVITNKAQAVRLVTRLNNEFAGSFESALALDEMTERLVNAGFITWADVDTAF